MIYHVPVLAAEVIDALQPEPGDVMVDCTLGGGGHSALIVSLIGLTGTIVGVDRDTEALTEATERFNRLPEGERSKIEFVHARYDLAPAMIRERGIEVVDGVLFDLGVSSHQLDATERGFSFKDPAAPLDMRMNQGSDEPTAADLLNELPAAELTRIFRDYADEKWAARIAQFVVERRRKASYETAGQLIETVMAAIPAAARPKDIHPATRVYQALRIAVNREFEALESALRGMVDLLQPGSRIVAISYHSGEDRIVKNSFALLSGKCVCPPNMPVCVCDARSPKLKILTKKPIVPQSSEIATNPRARSAKLRIAERI